eukprot:Opistho-1_new@47632
MAGPLSRVRLIPLFVAFCFFAGFLLPMFSNKKATELQRPWEGLFSAEGAAKSSRTEGKKTWLVHPLSVNPGRAALSVLQSCDVEIVRALIADNDWVPTALVSKADMIVFVPNFPRVTGNVFDNAVFDQAKKSAVLNRFPTTQFGPFEIGRRCNIARKTDMALCFAALREVLSAESPSDRVRQYSRKMQQRIAGAGLGTDEFDAYIPPTFVFLRKGEGNAAEQQRLETYDAERASMANEGGDEDLPSTDESVLYVVKPDAGENGRGMVVVSSAKEAAEVAMARSRSLSVIVQRVVPSPLLISGRARFDVRVYFAIMSVDPLEIYVNKRSTMVRLAPGDSVPPLFQAEKGDDPAAAVGGAEEEVGGGDEVESDEDGEVVRAPAAPVMNAKLSAAEELAEEAPAGPTDLRNFVTSPMSHKNSKLVWNAFQMADYAAENGFRDDWEMALGKMVSFASVPLGLYNTIKPHANSFQVVTCDYVVDSTFHPWFLDCNAVAQMARESAADYFGEVHQTLIEDLIKLVTNKRDRSEAGSWEFVYSDTQERVHHNDKAPDGD